MRLALLAVALAGCELPDPQSDREAAAADVWAFYTSVAPSIVGKLDIGSVPYVQWMAGATFPSQAGDVAGLTSWSSPPAQATLVQVADLNGARFEETELAHELCHVFQGRPDPGHEGPCFRDSDPHAPRLVERANVLLRTRP
jgi:hypothetical protein